MSLLNGTHWKTYSAEYWFLFYVVLRLRMERKRLGALSTMRTGIDYDGNRRPQQDKERFKL